MRKCLHSYCRKKRRFSDENKILFNRPIEFRSKLAPDPQNCLLLSFPLVFFLFFLAFPLSYIFYLHIFRLNWEAKYYLLLISQTIDP
jgi:hypothetical protein